MQSSFTEGLQINDLTVARETGADGYTDAAAIVAGTQSAAAAAEDPATQEADQSGQPRRAHGMLRKQHGVSLAQEWADGKASRMLFDE